MSRSLLSRLVCGLLVTILAALPLAAAEPAGPTAPLAAGLARLWSWLADLWGENGCYIDPDGRCHDSTGGTPSAPAETENGCFIDPNGGGCATKPALPDNIDAGCYIDPYGGCRD